MRRRRVGRTMWKVIKRGLADAALQLLRVGDAGRLHHDALVALSGDRDFAGAVGVDAAADDFDRLLRGLARQWRAAALPSCALRSAPSAPWAMVQNRIGARRERASAALSASQRALQHRRGSLSRTARGIAHARPRPVTDNARLGVAQRGRHLIGDIVQLLLAQRRDVHFEQDLRAAAQIEAEIDRLSGAEIAEHAVAHDLPAGNSAPRTAIRARSPPRPGSGANARLAASDYSAGLESLAGAGSVLLRTSAMVPRTTRTSTLGASSTRTSSSCSDFTLPIRPPGSDHHVALLQRRDQSPCGACAPVAAGGSAGSRTPRRSAHSGSICISRRRRRRLRRRRARPARKRLK